MTKDPRVYLAHILERAERIEAYIGHDEDAFLQDYKTQDAVIRNFEVIGEATKRLPNDYRRLHPEIPWHLMAGFRDVLIHDYEGVDMRRVWTSPLAICPRSRPRSELSSHLLTSSSVSWRAKALARKETPSDGAVSCPSPTCDVLH